MSEDQYVYSEEQVLSLLPQAFDRLATPKRDEDEDTRSTGDPALGGNHLAHPADIRSALKTITPAMRHALFEQAHGEPAGSLSEAGMSWVLFHLNGLAA